MVKKGNDGALLTIAIIAVVVSAIGFFVVWGTIFALNSIMLAPDTDFGTADVEIADNIDIEVDAATVSIDWGSSSVTTGQRAILSTLGAGTMDFFVDGTLQAQGFVVRNIGNKDVRVDAESSVDVTGFLGTPLDSTFELRADDNAGVACVDTAGATWQTWFAAAPDGGGDGVRICDQLSFDDGVANPDELIVDVKVEINAGVPPVTATSTITFTGEDYTIP